MLLPKNTTFRHTEIEAGKIDNPGGVQPLRVLKDKASKANPTFIL